MKKILNLALIASLSTSCLISPAIALTPNVATKEYKVGKPSLNLTIGKSFLYQEQILNQYQEKQSDSNTPNYKTPYDFSVGANHQASASILFDILPKLKMGLIFGSINPLGYFDESLAETTYKLNTEDRKIELFATSETNPLGLTVKGAQVNDKELETLLEFKNIFSSGTAKEQDDLIAQNTISKEFAQKYNLPFYVETASLREYVVNNPDIATFNRIVTAEAKNLTTIFSTITTELSLKITTKLSETDLADATKIKALKTFLKASDEFTTDFNKATADIGQVAVGTFTVTKQQQEAAKKLFNIDNNSGDITKFADAIKDAKDALATKPFGGGNIATSFDKVSKLLDNNSELVKLIKTLNADGVDDQKKKDSFLTTTNSASGVSLGANLAKARTELTAAILDALATAVDGLPTALKTATDAAISTGKTNATAAIQRITQAADELKADFDSKNGRNLDPIYKNTSSGKATTLTSAERIAFLERALTIIDTKNAIDNIYANGLKEANVKSAVKTTFVGGNIVAHNFQLSNRVGGNFGVSFGLGKLTMTEKLMLKTDANGNVGNDETHEFKRESKVDDFTWFGGLNAGLDIALSPYAKLCILANWQAYGSPDRKITESFLEIGKELQDDAPIGGVFDKTPQVAQKDKAFIGLQSFGISVGLSLNM